MVNNSSLSVTASLSLQLQRRRRWPFYVKANHNSSSSLSPLASSLTTPALDGMLDPSSMSTQHIISPIVNHCPICRCHLHSAQRQLQRQNNHHFFSSTAVVAAPQTSYALSTPSSQSNKNNNNNNNNNFLEPIDFSTQSQISGSESQILEVHLRPNQVLRAESGAMLYMSQGVTMETSMGSSSSSSSSIFQAGLARIMTGQNLMISDFRYCATSSSSSSSSTNLLPNNNNILQNESSNPNKDNSSSTTSTPTILVGYDDNDHYGTVGLGTDFPAKILKFDLSIFPSSKLICQKGAYLAGSSNVLFDMAYVKNFSGGFFGGEGFILQSLQGSSGVTDGTGGGGGGGGEEYERDTIPSKGGGSSSIGGSSSSNSIRCSKEEDTTTAAAAAVATTTTTTTHTTSISTPSKVVVGDGTVFLKAYGTIVKRDLQAGETLRISSGSLVCMTSTVDFDVTTVSGFANVVFGGQGLFITTLTGPGSVWLQSMPIDRMVSEIARNVSRSGGGIGLGIPIFGGGGGGGDGGDNAGGAGVIGENVDVVEEDGASDVIRMTTDDDVSAEADRHATILSSANNASPSSLSSSSSDPESPESLFGDAAYGGVSATMTPSDNIDSDATTTFSSNDDYYSSSSIPNNSDEYVKNDLPELDDSTVSEEELFEDDGTTFSKYDNGDDTATEIPPLSDDGSSSSSILGQLWDLFRDFTDRD